MEEPGRVGETERIPLERRLKDVAGDDPNRGGEVGFPEKLPTLFDTFGIRFEGYESTVAANALAEALEPKQGGASGVENVEIPDIPEEIQLAVTEGDEICLVCLSLLGPQRVSFV